MLCKFADEVAYIVSVSDNLVQNECQSQFCCQLQLQRVTYRE